MSKLVRIYGVLLLVVVVAISYIFVYLNSIHKNLNTNVEQLFVTQAQSFAHNIDARIHTLIPNDFFKRLENDHHVRALLEEELSLFITPQYKYIFVLYQDTKGNFRFLLDGSKEDKADFNQKLFVDKEVWKEVYTTKKSKIFKHENLEGLWITYLKPVVYNEQVVGIIAIDFSVGLHKSIFDSIKPLNDIFFYGVGLTILIFIILMIQAFLNFKTKKESFTDPLTQAYNRAYLKEFLHKNDYKEYQIMMLDIDFFKKVNDTYGHKAGDVILQEVAAIIRDNIREYDVLIRYGGEEFLVLIKRKNPNAQYAYSIAQRIQVGVERNHFAFEKQDIHITVSIGINCHPENFDNFNAALSYADAMLYEAKRTGRNKIVREKTQTST